MLTASAGEMGSVTGAWNWSDAAEGDVAFRPDAAAQLGDRLIIAGENGYDDGLFISAYDIATGAKQWQIAPTPIESDRITGLIPVDGAFYVSGIRAYWGGNYSFVARVRADGTVDWVSDLGCARTAQSFGFCVPPAMVATPAGVIVTTAGAVHELSAVDGTAVARWLAPFGDDQSQTQYSLPGNGAVFALTQGRTGWQIWLSALRAVPSGNSWRLRLPETAAGSQQWPMGVVTLQTGSVVAVVRAAPQSSPLTRHTFFVIDAPTGAESARWSVDFAPRLSGVSSDGVCLAGDVLLTWSVGQSAEVVLTGHSLTTRTAIWTESVPLGRAVSCINDRVTVTGGSSSAPQRGFVEQRMVASGALLWRTDMTSDSPSFGAGVHALPNGRVIAFDQVQSGVSTFASRVRQFAADGQQLQPLDVGLRSAARGRAVMDGTQRVLTATTSTLHSGTRIRQSSIAVADGVETWKLDALIEEPALVFEPRLQLFSRAAHVAAIVTVEGAQTMAGVTRTSRLVHRESSTGLLRWFLPPIQIPAPFASAAIADDGSPYVVSGATTGGIVRYRAAGIGLVWGRANVWGVTGLVATNAGVMTLRDPSGVLTSSTFGADNGATLWERSPQSTVGISPDGLSVVSVESAVPLRVVRQDAFSGVVSAGVQLAMVGNGAVATHIVPAANGGFYVVGFNRPFGTVLSGWIARVDSSLSAVMWTRAFSLPSGDELLVSSVVEGESGEVLATLRPAVGLRNGDGPGLCLACPEYMLRLNGNTGSVLGWHYLGTFGPLLPPGQEAEVVVLEQRHGAWITASHTWTGITPNELTVRRRPWPEFGTGTLDVSSTATATPLPGGTWQIEIVAAVTYSGSEPAEGIVVETDFQPGPDTAASVVIAGCTVVGGGQCDNGYSAGQARQLLTLNPGATASIRLLTTGHLGEARPPMQVLANLPTRIGSSSLPAAHIVQLPTPPADLILQDSFE